MSRFVKIGKAAEILGVSIQTLRRWETLGSFMPDQKSSGGTRYYSQDKLFGLQVSENELTICYARVSRRLYGARSHKNKKLILAAKILIDDADDTHAYIKHK